MLELDRIYENDCRFGLRELDENSIDAVITDPPYELGFMDKQWDNTGIAYNMCMWQSVLRALKPGGHLLSFGGSRTYHRMACAIEDAGFEVRDQIMWVYGSGFPKSLNIGKAIDNLQGNKREILNKQKRKGRSSGILGKETDIIHVNDKGLSEWEGWGTALKPAHEPIVLARKSLSESTVAKNVVKWCVGGLNIDACRIQTNDKILIHNNPNPYSFSGNKSEIDYVNSSIGRFPANFIHDGSEEVTELFPNTGGGGKPQQKKRERSNVFSYFGDRPEYNPYHDTVNGGGSTSRFFYCAKASKEERDRGLNRFNGKQMDESRKEGNPGGDNPRNRGIHIRYNFHPTVKPIALMEYLIKLVTREGQLVLDPFIGSGTTAIACKKLNRRFIGFEINHDYCNIAEKRLKNVPERLENYIVEG